MDDLAKKMVILSNQMIKEIILIHQQNREDSDTVSIDTIKNNGPHHKTRKSHHHNYEDRPLKLFKFEAVIDIVFYDGTINIEK